MKFLQHAITIIAASVLLTASMAVAAPSKQSTISQGKKHTSSKAHKSSRHAAKKSRKPRGQQAIDNERATQIQQALVREHYLSGEPSGTWDAATQGALRRYQSDQGWQSKTVPDSRALIRLGLGPNHDHLLNPESAMVGGGNPVRSTRAANNSGSGSLSLSGQSSGNAATSPVSVSPDLSSAR